MRTRRCRHEGNWLTTSASRETRPRPCPVDRTLARCVGRRRPARWPPCDRGHISGLPATDYRVQLSGANRSAARCRQGGHYGVVATRYGLGLFSISLHVVSAFLINLLQRLLQISASPLRPINFFVLTFTYFGVIAAAYGARSLSVRPRLLASAVRCARLVRASCPDPVPDAAQLAYESFIHLDLRGERGRDRFFQLLVRNPRHRHRVTVGIA
jgi:hypothetical protein